MINEVPTIFEVVTGAAKKQVKEKSSVSNHSGSKSKSNFKARSEVEESEYYSEELVRAPDPVEVLHVDGEGSNVGEEGSEGFEGDEGFEEESEIHDEFGDGFYDNWEERAINEIADLGCMNLKEITVEEIKSLHFPDREVAFLFYNLYAKMNGFAARRYRSRRNLNNELIQQSFVCFRQGFRKARICDGVEVADWKREPKPETRCGCEAEMRVHIDKDTGRWIVTYFQEVHNHKMLEDTLTFMLPGHRRMNSAAIDQMNMMLKVGIKTPQIYASFVQTAGGCENVPFLKRDMYNRIDKQRRIIGGDASACLKLLQRMEVENPGMFVRHLADKDGRLVHLFWCDNCSQLDYEIFGDVLAFDATYRKNKYMCPLVVFSGVNHHNQTIVFAAALVANETEETYKWLLQQFLEGMKGKAPECVITDGHGAMKKAIESVFPNSYHRLCAWHLLRNATSNISNPVFTSEFKKCMLFDYEVAEFEQHWNNVVSELGLQDNPWVCDLYARRHMWATAHIRGNFFGGFRTTSRCEGLHSMLGKFVHSRHNLKDFVEQFFRCISQMRSREAFSDLQSTVGDMVLQSPLRSLERSAASVLTREIFLIFRPMLSRACTLKVRSCTFTACSDIYSLFRSGDSAREWRVSHYRNGSFFKCSCMRMETLGIPCDHIIAVFHHLDITEMPASVILERWSKDARSRVRAFMEKGPFCWDSMVTCRNWMLNDLCRELCVLASAQVDDFVDVTGKLRNEILHLKSKRVSPIGEGTDPLVSSTLEDCVRDPQVLRHHKRRKFGVGRQPSSKGIKRCGICRAVGHNRLSCSQRHTHGQGHTAVDSGTQRRAVYEEADYGDYEDSWEECHLWSGHDASENHEDESCEEDHYLDVSLSEP